MRLIKVRLLDFRRFAGEHSLDLNEDLVALVGPNEAGKSSLLYAIDLLGKKGRPQPQDVTRGQTGPAIIRGLFLLESHDRAALATIKEADSVSHMWLEIRSDRDGHTSRPEPPPLRDRSQRSSCLKLLDSIIGDPDLIPQGSTPNDLQWDPQILTSVLQILASEAESLSGNETTSFEALAQRLRAIRSTAIGQSELRSEVIDSSGESKDSDAARAAARDTAATALFALAAHERKPHPEKEVASILTSRIPQVALFDEKERELSSTYKISDVVAAMPPAFANLCVVADLDIHRVHNDLSTGKIPHVERTFERANKTLKERFQSTWTQSDVYPRLSTPSDGTLRVLIATEGDEDYSYPLERSDGLRWFLALHAFLVARGQQQPLLLVDEAETHLHYDAQADLVDALMSQRVASQVVYSTHSVGCLPPDLGSGIRAVLADSDSERSRIVNSYWSVGPGNEDRIGYAPLLFAMGARLLALTIPRYGVVAEGPSDAVLLPTLFREVESLTHLPYRIVPGLSNLADSRVERIETHAGKTVCLTDDDDAGREIRRRLSENGIDGQLLLHLGMVIPNCTLEDLVLPSVFASAVNREIETWNLGGFRVDAGVVPVTGRWRWLEQTGRTSGASVDRLSKVRVAQRVVDLGRESERDSKKLTLVDPRYVDSLRNLHSRFLALLGIRPRA